MMKKDQLDNLALEIKFHLSRYAIDWRDIRLIFDESDLQTIEKAELIAQTIISTGKAPEDSKAFRWFARILKEKKELDIDLSVFDSKFRKAWNFVKRLFVIILLSFISFVVLVGVGGGYSSLLKNSPPSVSLIILLLLIILLGAVEGLHVCVTTLRLKDLHDHKLKFPRAHSLHNKFKSLHGTNRFLGGRQLFVIIIVFFTAQLTSFPTMEKIPFTSVGFPFWFKKIFLELGIAGALFVLWFGQLVPQFIANKHPHGFLNVYFIKLIFHISYFAESLEITRPGDLISNFLSKRIPDNSNIPISPGEKYDFDVNTIHGYGIICLKKMWEVKRNSSTLVYENAFIFKKSGFTQIIDNSLLTPKTITHLKYNVQLIKRTPTSNDNSKGIIPNIEAIDVNEEWKQINQTLKSAFGPFEVDDVVVANTVIEYDGHVEYDVIRVVQPTNYLLFRITFVDSPSEISSIKLEILKTEETLGQDIVLDEKTPILSKDQDNNYYFEYIHLYPSINTSFELSWKAKY